ncbi:uncharacterized protein [Amphiura filiformis]|uniref:uncharacterized protein n=1 Tax=Amphiura filiformis TaxID=82378 RepID=UPI003B224AA3
MPSVDQVTKFDQSSEETLKSGVKDDLDLDVSCVLGKDTSKQTGAVADDKLCKENGHVKMEGKRTKNVNAHLVKTDMICLDRSPVKPVKIETNGLVKTEINKMDDGKKVSNGCHGDGDATDFNGSTDDSAELKKKTTSCPDEESEKAGKLCTKPASFDLLGDQFSQQRIMLSKNAAAAARQKGLDSGSVFEGGNEGIKTEKEEVNKDDKDIDQLAESLGASLQIAPAAVSKDGIKQERDQQVSDLADDLSRGLNVRDDGLESKVIVVKKEDTVTIPPDEEIIIIKQEPDDEERSLQETIVKKEPEDGGSKKDSGRFSKGVSGDRRPEIIARGVNDDSQNQYPTSMPMTGGHFVGQQSYPTTNISGHVPIPSFQMTFIDRNQLEQYSHAGQFVRRNVQLQQKNILPPCYNMQQQQPIMLPSSPHHSSKPIIVPPVSSLYQQSERYSQPQQLYHQQFTPHQNQYPLMQLQEPQQSMITMPTVAVSTKQPEESLWPDSPTHLEEDMASPQSTSSDGASYLGSNPLSPQYSNQSSPPQTMFPPTSPYQTVPTRSPELPPANSPQAPSPQAPSPSSPYTISHTVKAKAGSSNFGVVTEITDKPTSPKRQKCVEDANKDQRVKEIIGYLEQGSPQAALEPDTVYLSNYHAALSPDSASSVDSFPPSPKEFQPHQSQEPQRSPPPGVSPAQAVHAHQYPPPQQAVVVPQQFQGFTQQVIKTSQHQPQVPVEAVVPIQAANQQEYEAQEWRQKVACLSDAQLKEQDEQDQDTILHLAIIHGMKFLMFALVERLLKYPDAINVRNKLSQTPLYLAAATDQPELVYHLIINGADPTIPAERAGNTPLHYAAEQGFVDVIEAIFQGLGRSSPDSFIDAKNFEGRSPLHIAVESHGTPVVDHMGDMVTIDSLQTIEVLIKYGASAMCQDGKSGKTALHYAVEMHKREITRLLLEQCDNAGELVNCQMYNGNTALHLIVGRHEIPVEEILRVVSTLMQFGANVSIENAEKDTAARLVQNGHDVIKKHLSGQAHSGR